MAKCHGILRTPRGDRLLMLLTTNREDPELMTTIGKMRSFHEYHGFSDEQLLEALEQMIAKIPKKCKECDKTGSD